MKRYHLGLFSLFLVFSLILGNISLSFAQKVPSPNFYNTPADYQKATGKRIVKFGESPMLTNLVKQNKLLPIEKRLLKILWLLFL